mmetsp:Transcript_174144/g.558394  ORF Transcript_174144/g.558394 Transcript_174144/m.558394 type:complete len:211 (-) Transcript_174144:956-1588(-)
MLASRHSSATFWRPKEKRMVRSDSSSGITFRSSIRQKSSSTRQGLADFIAVLSIVLKMATSGTSNASAMRANHFSAPAKLPKVAAAVMSNLNVRRSGCTSAFRASSNQSSASDHRPALAAMAIKLLIIDRSGFTPESTQQLNQRTAALGSGSWDAAWSMYLKVKVFGAKPASEALANHTSVGPSSSVFATCRMMRLIVVVGNTVPHSKAR